jgi:hypothetical protein
MFGIRAQSGWVGYRLYKQLIMSLLSAIVAKAGHIRKRAGISIGANGGERIAASRLLTIDFVSFFLIFNKNRAGTGNRYGLVFDLPGWILISAFRLPLSEFQHLPGGPTAVSEPCRRRAATIGSPP